MTGTLPSSLSVRKSSLAGFAVYCKSLSGELPDLDWATMEANDDFNVGGPQDGIGFCGRVGTQKT